MGAVNDESSEHVLARFFCVFYLLFPRRLIVEDDTDVFQHGDAKGYAVVF